MSLKTLGLGVEHFPRYVNPTVRLHTLDVVLLSVILRGRGQHYIDTDRFEEVGASVAVTHAGQRHDIITDAAGMDVLNVYLDLDRQPLPVLPRELQSVLPLLLPLHPRFAHRLNRIVRVQFEDISPVADILFALRHELDTRPPGYLEASSLLFRMFLILCCRRAVETGLVPPTADGQANTAALEDLRRYLDAHYAEAHSLAALARRVRLSRTYLCRAFKAYTGKPVIDYLVERRIQAAMIALRSSSDKVLTIALECGFRDLTYFNRKFKELVGATPTAYRSGV